MLRTKTSKASPPPLLWPITLRHARIGEVEEKECWEGRTATHSLVLYMHLCLGCGMVYGSQSSAQLAGEAIGGRTSSSSNKKKIPYHYLMEVTEDTEAALDDPTSEVGRQQD